MVAYLCLGRQRFILDLRHFDFPPARGLESAACNDSGGVLDGATGSLCERRADGCICGDSSSVHVQPATVLEGACRLI